MLLRPLPAAWLVPLAAVVLTAGAAYCLGYEGLQGGIGEWPGSYLWSAYAVLPWLALFEAVKRAEWERDRPFDPAMLVLLLMGTGLFSVGLEYLVDGLRGSRSAPAGLLVMRRLPAIAATLLLLLLARREWKAAMSGEPAPATTSEAETLRGQAESVRWIQAADNYLELHLPGQVLMRRLTMREAASILEPLGFVRIHRSYLVNRRHVAAVVRGNGRVAVETVDGNLLPTGRAFSAEVRRLG
jgi:DNA-binding LytR/AlgR family response regulator